jgi:hypothetical protein
MEKYSLVKEMNDGEQLPKTNRGVDCRKKEGMEMLATDNTS